MPENLKERMVSELQNSLIANEVEVPGIRYMHSRLRGFYSTRRTSILTKKDDQRTSKRKLAVKASAKTYVS